MTRSLMGSVDPPDLHVMTFNVRRRLDGVLGRRVDHWSTRRPRVHALFRAERPTLLGVQEAMPDQAAAIGHALGPDYRFVGHGRDRRRRGEGCPVFFDTTRLELLDWEQTALSDRPHAAGSISWGNVVPRVVVRATFRDRATATPFTLANTHLDPFSPPSRVRAARCIRRLLSGSAFPAIVMGDLNARAGSPTLRELLQGDGLIDAWAAAERRMTPPWGTFANYRPPREDGARIDWIVTSPAVTVVRAAINAGTFDGGWPSDHLPVQAVLRVPAESGTT